MCRAALKLLASIALVGALCSIALANEADDQFAMAAGHYSASHWDLAIDGFRSFLHDNPDSPKHAKALFFEAESLAQLGRYAEASPLFLDAMAEQPNGPLARQSLFRVAEAAMKCGKIDEAQLRFSQFQIQYPSDKSNATVLLYLGTMSLRAGDVPAAERCFRQSVEQFGDMPTADECRIGLVKALALQSKTDSAESLLKEVAGHDHSPWSETAILQLAARELTANQLQSAFELFESVGTRFPTSPMLAESQLGSAEALYRLGRLDDARKQLSLVARKKDLTEKTAQLLALVQKAQEQQKAALAATKAAELAAKKATEAAELAAQQKMREAAEKKSQKAVAATLPPPEPLPSAPLISIMTRSPSAEPVAPAAIVPDNKEPVAVHEDRVRRRSAAIRAEAAEAMIKSGDLDRAINVLQIGDNSGDDPRSMTNRYLLSTTLKKVGRSDESMQSLDGLSKDLAERLARPASADDLAALRLLDQNVQFLRGTSLANSSRYGEAIAPLQKYLVSLNSATIENEARANADRARSTLAICLANTGRLEEARRVIAELQTASPHNQFAASASQQVAEAASAAGQHKIAAEMFAVLATEGNSPETVAKGLAALGQSQLEAGDNAAAAQTFAKFLERFPKDPQAPEIALARGQALVVQGLKEAALMNYRQALTRYSKTKALPKILAAAARLADELKKDEEAAPLYERLVREFPDIPETDAALYNWAWCLRDLCRGNESEKVFRQVYEQYPNSNFWADSTFRLAERALQRGDRAAADTFLDQLMTVGCPVSVLEHALFLQGQTAIGDQNWSAAEGPLKRMLNEFPEGELHLAAEYWLAELEYRKGDFEAAQRRFDTLMPRIASHDQAWMAMVPLRCAQLLADQKQWTSARAAAETIAHDYPKFNQQFEADYVIARSLAAEGNFDGARESALRVVRSAAGSRTETAAKAQCLIGDSYLAQDNTSTALREYMRVESVYPFPQWQASALLKAAKCQEELGHAREAAELYARGHQRYHESEVIASAGKRPADAVRK